MREFLRRFRGALAGETDRARVRYTEPGGMQITALLRERKDGFIWRCDDKDEEDKLNAATAFATFPSYLASPFEGFCTNVLALMESDYGAAGTMVDWVDPGTLQDVPGDAADITY